MGLGELLRDFSNWSTVGGVPHIANSKTWVVRLFWIIIVLGLGSVFIYQLVGMIRTFIKFPASITTEISIEQQTFPAVTVCNLNPYKKKIVANGDTKTAFDIELDTFMDYYVQVVNGLTTPDTYGILNTTTTWERETRARDVVNMIAGQHPDVVNQSLYSFDEIIADCTFNGISCSESDFTQFVDPSFGRCFTYNNFLNTNLTISRAGKAFGLQLLVTVHQSDINDTISTYHPLFSTAGAKVSVHTPTEYPNAEGTGLNVGVGYTTAIALTAAEYQLAKKPYGECITQDSADRNYYQSYKYSTLTCYNTCRQKDVFAKCSCHNPRYFGPATGASFCTPTPTNVTCLNGLKGDQYSAIEKNMDALTECKCMPSCFDQTFAMTTSMSTFPSGAYQVVADPTNTTTNDGMGSCTTDNTKFPNVESCLEWYAYNALQIQIFFETMRKETYVESSSYGLSTMVNDLGGQAGLYLGLSIISLIECIGLLILLCAFCVTGGRVAIRPYDDEFDRDHRIMEIEDLKRALDEHDRLDNAQKKMAEKDSDDSSDDEKPQEKTPGSPKKEKDEDSEKEEEKKEDKKEDQKKKDTESEYSGSDLSDDGSIEDSEDEDDKNKKKK